MTAPVNRSECPMRSWFALGAFDEQEPSHHVHGGEPCRARMSDAHLRRGRVCLWVRKVKSQERSVAEERINARWWARSRKLQVPGSLAQGWTMEGHARPERRSALKTAGKNTAVEPLAARCTTIAGSLLCFSIESLPRYADSGTQPNILFRSARSFHPNTSVYFFDPRHSSRPPPSHAHHLRPHFVCIDQQQHTSIVAPKPAESALTAQRLLPTPRAAPWLSAPNTSPS